MLSLEALIFIIYNLFQAGRGIVVSAALFATPAQIVEHNPDKCCPLIAVEADHSCWQCSRSSWLMCPFGFLGLPQCCLDALPFKKHQLSSMCRKKTWWKRQDFPQMGGNKCNFYKNLTGFILYFLNFKITVTFRNAFFKCW